MQWYEEDEQHIQQETDGCGDESELMFDPNGKKQRGKQNNGDRKVDSECENVTCERRAF